MVMRYQDLHVNGEDFSYKTKDTIAEVEAPGYFDQVWERLYRLDYIRVTADINTPAPPMRWFRVDKIDGTNVHVSGIGEWDHPEAMEVEREPKDPDKRVEIIIAGVKQFMLKHPDAEDRDFYTTSGLPDARLLQPFCGFPCSSDDRDNAWSVIQAEVTEERRVGAA